MIFRAKIAPLPVPLDAPSRRGDTNSELGRPRGSRARPGYGTQKMSLDGPSPQALLHAVHGGNGGLVLAV